MNNSRFISFEGGEGSGKSTQIKLLAKKLSKKRKVIITREPGGTKDAEKIRNLIVKDKNQKWSGAVETMLLFAARKDHIDKIILPNLKKGYWVLCDRYIDSTMAYQGYGKKVDVKLINSLNKILIKNLVIDKLENNIRLYKKQSLENTELVAKAINEIDKILSKK